MTLKSYLKLPKRICKQNREIEEVRKKRVSKKKNNNNKNYSSEQLE